MSIADLDPNTPTDGGPAGQGDNEIRALKQALLLCLPALDGEIQNNSGTGSNPPDSATFSALFDRLASLEGGAGTGTLPVGSILHWFGPVNAIPAGFALCDGTNGTPNLSDRFVYGTTDQNYDPTTSIETGGDVGDGSTGPATPSTASVAIPNHTISVDNLPEHRHFVARAGLTTGNSPPVSGGNLTSANQVSEGSGTSDDRKYVLDGVAGEPNIGRSSRSGGVPSPDPLTHGSATVNFAHTHDLTGALPPYTRLAFIMYTG